MVVLVGRESSDDSQDRGSWLHSFPARADAVACSSRSISSIQEQAESSHRLHSNQSVSLKQLLFILVRHLSWSSLLQPMAPIQSFRFYRGAPNDRYKCLDLQASAEVG